MEGTKTDRRILVVDDLPDMRATIVGLFEDKGYSVMSATSRKEALTLISSNSFHIAVLDIRLDDADDTNQDGIKLLDEIQEIDPTLIPIILSGYIDFEIYEKYKNISIVEKSVLLNVVGEVEQAFLTKIRINWHLILEDEESFFDEIPHKFRFSKASNLSTETLISECRELLRKLFSDVDFKKISITPIRRGYSSTIVLKVIPWLREMQRGEVIIAKIGERKRVQEEIERYMANRRFVGGNRLPTQLETAETRNLAGIIYTLAGLGDAQDFVTFYENSSSPQIADAITNLFYETCFPRRLEKISNETQDLGQTYQEILKLKNKKLDKALDKTLDGRSPFKLSKDKKSISLPDGSKLLNPVAFIEKNDLHSPSYTTTIHGDLHGYNVLVDHRAETWLIDFADTGYGPLWHDFTVFESFLKISLFEDEEWNTHYEWESFLTKNIDLEGITLPDSISRIKNIDKLFSAIKTVRGVALAHGMTETRNAYQTGLLFNAVRLIAIEGLPVHQRNHALIAAGFAAETL